MFLRKLFSKDNKFTWVAIDLVIVIIGVYCAFAIQNYADGKKVQNERSRVLTALKYEMEIFRYRMYETALGMNSLDRELKEIQAAGTYSNFLYYRFIEPQYDYQTIAYAINLQNSEIVDFALYDKLQSLLVEIKKIEHVERLLTETSRKYKSISPQLNKQSSLYYSLDSENRDNFTRFITLIEDRAQISARIAEASTLAMPLVNERLGIHESREIEKQLLVENMARVVRSEEQAVTLGRQFFSHFSEEEIRDLYRQSKAGKNQPGESELGEPQTDGDPE